MTAINLANESALGVYVFTWTDPGTGNRGGISWYEGSGDPLVEWHRPSGQNIRRLIANPGRFGWSDPSGKPSSQQMRAVQNLTRAYAEQLAAEEQS